MRIANPQSSNRLGRFLTADCKSAETPNGINHLKKTAYEERNLENCISDSNIYLDRYCRLSGRDELHVVELHKES